MKKVIVLIALIMVPLISQAQSDFDKLEDMKGVESVIISKDAFEILSKFNVNSDDNEAMEVFKMIQDLNEFKMFSTNNKEVSNKMEGMVKDLIKKSKLIELMRIKEDDSRIKIYVKSISNKDFVSEVLMFIKGLESKTNGFSESMIISLTGNIDINKMSKLADTFTNEGRKSKQ